VALVGHAVFYIPQMDRLKERDNLRDIKVNGRINIKINIEDVIYDYVHYIPEAEDTNQWWALLSNLLNLHIPYNLGIFSNYVGHYQLSRTVFPVSCGWFILS
jgi:hypothetical protein